MPPDAPSYTLRRVWLSPEEEEGYYLGFRMKACGPVPSGVCARLPDADWRCYPGVNRKFADAVVQEAESANSGGADPGLPLRCSTTAPRAHSARHDWTVLARSVAQRRDLWGLSVATRLLSLHAAGGRLADSTRSTTATTRSTPSIVRLNARSIANMSVTLQGHVCRVAAYP